MAGLPDTAGASFEQRLFAASRAGLDWFQPLDISLPGGPIASDTPMHLSKPVFDMVVHERMLDMAEALLGLEITSNPIQHVRIKPPLARLARGEERPHVAGTDWHQDRGVGARGGGRNAHDHGLGRDDRRHRGERLPSGRAGRASLGHGAALPDVRGQLAIARGHLDEAARGAAAGSRGRAAVVLHPLAPHAALPNRSGTIRWSFDLRYNVTGEPTGRAHFPAFVARSRSDPGSELRDHRLWRAMWEEARAMLAAAPHIPIHRWSADAAACA